MKGEVNCDVKIKIEVKTRNYKLYMGNNWKESFFKHNEETNKTLEDIARKGTKENSRWNWETSQRVYLKKGNT